MPNGFPMKRGERNGRLVAVEIVKRSPSGAAFWRFRCDCGTETTARAASVRFGTTKSCGCLRTETIRTASKTHGKRCGGAMAPIYRSWLSMKQRCHNPSDTSYENYGARGIEVCERWRSSFEAFAADMGPRPEGHTIDRINVDGNYEPGNCRWATATEQVRNRRITQMVEYGGETIPVAQACESAGISYGAFRQRLARGATPEQALSARRVP